MSTSTRPAPPASVTRPVPPPDAPSPARRPAAAITVGVLFVVIGTVALLATLGIRVPRAAIAPGLLVLIGVGVAASGARGEPEGWLVGLAVGVGVVLAIGALATTVLDVPLEGGVGDRRHKPMTVAELDDEYRLLAGSLVVDLRDLDLPPGTTELAVSTALGEAEVWLPDDVVVEIETTVGGGTAFVLDEVHEGMGVEAVHRSEDWVGADQRLHLEVGVGLGEVRVAG